ncbi:MAG: hypothetical protein R2834_07980 [Rhodothermales bacterium]
MSIRAATLLLAILGASLTRCATEEPTRWWKGNLHTHSLWSDGDDYPEMIVGWYRDRDYDFIALSDHNVIAEGERWIDVDASRGGRPAFDRYLAAYGDTWVEQRTSGDTLFARLRTLAEYRPLFEAADSFLVIKSEELTDGYDGKPVHINVTNIHTRIAPQRGGSLRQVMQRNVDAVRRQRDSTGVPMFPHINHPNFGWAMTAEDLLTLHGERFFEVYNGHPAVHNEGDSLRPGTERMWDIINTRRLLNGDPLMLGMAVDDSHNYLEMGPENSNPGRAWVMVKADTLSAEALVDAMEAGAFYGTTGVLLNEVRADRRGLSIDIRPEAGVTYTTYFYGTPVAHDTTSAPVQLPDGAYVTRRYSNEIGQLLGQSTELTPHYTFTGNELYVRARVVSSKPKTNPYRAGETETAWTQPVVPASF